MLDNGVKQEMLRGLHQGLSQVATEVRATRGSIRMTEGNIATVGELSERKIDPAYVKAERQEVYYHYNVDASFVPSQEVVEGEIAERIAKYRTERVAASLAPVVVPEVVLMEDATPRVH